MIQRNPRNRVRREREREREREKGESEEIRGKVKNVMCECVNKIVMQQQKRATKDEGDK